LQVLPGTNQLIQRIKNKVKVLRADPHMKEVARGTLLAFILKVAGSGLALSFNVAVARLLGAEGAGLYFLALAVTTIGSVIGRVGLDNALLRFVATHATHGEWGQVRAVHALGMRLAIAVSATLSLIGFFAANWMAAALFNKPELGEPLRWMSLSILPFAILNLQAESLKGLKRIRDAMLVQGIGVPMIGLLLVWPLAHVAGVEGVSWGYLAATSLVALLSILAWHNAATPRNNEEALVPYPFHALWVSCKPLFVTSFMSAAVMPWAPLLMLGLWVTTAEVGIFGAATRLALLLSFLLITLNNVVAPKFAELHTRGDIAALGRLARRSAAMLTVMVSPLFVLLFIFSKEVMMLFGAEFATGGPILAVLLVGQLVNVISGSVGYLLMMSGYEKINRNIIMTAALVQLGLVVILAPVFGGLGAAIASAISVASTNLLAVYFVYKKLGIMTIPGVKLFL